MVFELGKYYKHTLHDNMIHVCGYALTHFYGETLIAEDTHGEFVPIGSKEENTINYSEITKEEFLSKS